MIGISIMDKEMLKILKQQLKNNFGLSEEEAELLGGGYFTDAYAKTLECLRHFRVKYLDEKINMYNSVEYGVFLYWLSHNLYENGVLLIADKIYYLNKALNGNDIFYAIKLPQHWLCEHPVGAVLGRAIYGDSFFFYQGCTIGGNIVDGGICYPVIGENMTMFSDAKILGNSVVGDNCVISANTYIINEVIPDNSVVFGSSPNLVIKKNMKTQNEWIGL